MGIEYSWLTIREQMIRAGSLTDIWIVENLRNGNGWAVMAYYSANPAGSLLAGLYPDKETAVEVQRALGLYSMGLLLGDEFEMIRARNCLDMTDLAGEQGKGYRNEN